MIFGKHINRYYLRYAGWLILGICSLLVIDWMELYIPGLYRQVINGINDGYNVIDGVQVPFDVRFLALKICLPMAIVVLSMVAFRFLWRICFVGTSLKVGTDLRARMFDHCKDLSQQYYQVNKVGNLMSLFTNDLETIEECFGWGILMVTDALCLGGMAFVKMWRMNILLTLLSMIPLAIMFVIGIIMGKALEAKWEARQAAFSAMSDFSQETYSGIAVVKAFVNEYRELLTFRKHNKENERTNVEFVKISMQLDIFTELLIESVICVILGYGGYLAHQGIFNAGELIEYISYFDSIVWPVIAVAELIKMSSQGKASLNRVSELLDAEVDVKDSDSVSIDDHIQLTGEIEFRNLTFSYPGSELKVLKNASFTVKAGENVGIIGRTGVGKTTVADLLLRTYNVPDGTIFLDGMDVNTLPIKGVRRNIAYVPQDNFLFSDTIENNIAFFEERHPKNEVHSAVMESAKLANVHTNIQAFASGYETVLGERGVTVSGGQKQRISIARALIRHSPILVMDDSVSAVDTETEHIILENLRENRKGMTTLLIGHRISTMEQMDRIIFIDGGTVVAAGTHAELMETCPEYHKMAELQRIEDKKKRGGIL